MVIRNRPAQADAGAFTADFERLFSAMRHFESSRAGKNDPKVFAMRSRCDDRAGSQAALPFKAELTNPIPKDRSKPAAPSDHGGGDPRATPLTGRYAFDGDCGPRYNRGDRRHSGLDRRVHRAAESDSRQGSDQHAQLPTSIFPGQRVRLDATFDAVVDGTDGDTYLNDVSATLLKTSISAKGAVTGTRGVKGRTVKLDVAVADGRIEHLLKLSVKAEKPLMVGDVALHTDFLLPPERRTSSRRTAQPRRSVESGFCQVHRWG